MHKNYLIFIILFIACASPTPKFDQQNFASQDEIQAISLDREGLYYFSNSRFEEAEKKFRAALKIRPKEPNFQYNLALTLSSQEKYEEAKVILDRLIKDYPNDLKYIKASANLDYQEKNIASAINKLEQASKLEATKAIDKAQIRSSLAKLYIYEGNFNAALPIAKEAYELSNSEFDFETYVRILLVLKMNQEVRMLLQEYKPGTAPVVTKLSAYLEFFEANYQASFDLAKRLIDKAANQPGSDLSEVTLFAIVANELGKLNIDSEEFSTSQISALYKGSPLDSPLEKFWPESLKNYLRSL